MNAGYSTEWFNEILKPSYDYSVEKDIFCFIKPENIVGSDKEMNARYELIAPFYDFFERVVGRVLTGVDIAHGRDEIVDLLGLGGGSSFIEVSPGSGVFYKGIRQKLGMSANVVAVDLSMNMLLEFKKNNNLENTVLVCTDAHDLPFADESFDALFHFGGINLFNDPSVALKEFVRVVKKGGMIAWGDEQMADTFGRRFARWLLPKINHGFLKQEPELPCGLLDVKKHIVYDGLGYLYTARKKF